MNNEMKFEEEVQEVTRDENEGTRVKYLATRPMRVMCSQAVTDELLERIYLLQGEG